MCRDGRAGYDARLPVTGRRAHDGEEDECPRRQAAVVMRVDKAARPSVVRWTALAFEPLPDWAGTTISFDVSPNENGGSRLHFRHTGMTPRVECFNDCSLGWRNYLASLVAYVDLGQGNPSAGPARRTSNGPRSHARSSPRRLAARPRNVSATFGPWPL
jgi:hypothetical protein